MGDEILSVNGTKVSNGEELKITMEKNNANGAEIAFEIARDGEEKSYTVKPEPYKTKTLGLFAAERVKGQNAIDILKYSAVEVKYWIETTVASLGQLITGKLSVKDLSGPVGIVDTVGSVIEESSQIGMSEMLLDILYGAGRRAAAVHYHRGHS